MPMRAVIIPELENYDPFGNFLRRKLHFSPVIFGLIILLLNILVDSWIGWQYEAFLKTTFPKSSPPGILQDFMALVTDIAYMPILGGLYLWTIQGSRLLFQRLMEARVFQQDHEFTRVVDSMRRFYSSRLAFAVILILSVVLAIFQLGAYLGWFGWRTVGGYIEGALGAAFYRFPFWILLFYTLGFAAYNVAISIFTLRKAFRTAEIQILPLHPDKCGGLGSISRYTNKVGLGIGTIGLVLSAATLYEVLFGDLGKALPVLAGIGAYLVFAPFFFFLPLGSAHESMRRAKEEELLGIAQRFMKSYQGLKSKTRTAGEYDEQLNGLVNIKKLYEVADAFPVWPFDVRSLRQFLTIITTPLLPALIAVLEAFLPTLLGK